MSNASGAAAPWVVAEPEVAPDDVLEQPNRLTLNELADHVAEDSPNGVKALVRLADVGQAKVVEQDLLDDKDSDRLGELRSRLHDAQAEGDDLGRQEEVDDRRVVVLLVQGGQGQDYVLISFYILQFKESGYDRRTLTRAPMTPRLVSRRYSNGLVLDVVFRNG